MTFEEKCNAAVLETAKYIEKIRQIDPSLNALVIVDNGEISLLNCTHPKNTAIGLGLLDVARIRLEYREREVFAQRMFVQEKIDEMKEQQHQQNPVRKDKLN